MLGRVERNNPYPYTYRQFRYHEWTIAKPCSLAPCHCSTMVRKKTNIYHHTEALIFLKIIKLYLWHIDFDILYTTHPRQANTSPRHSFRLFYNYTHILLPETSYLEAEDLVDSSYSAGSHNYMIALQRTIEPMWEVRSTYDICADIAGHLGLREQFTEGKTQAQWAELHYQQIREKRPYLPEWQVAKEMGVIDQRIATEKESIAFADFRADPQANPLKTPSGKIEVYSQALADLAQKWILPEGDRIPAVPEFCVVKESHLNKELTAKYPLQLSGFHTKGHTHSTYTNVLMLHEAVPDEVWINPIDASARQLSSGDLVHVFNDRGVVEIPCKVTQRILPGVVAMPQGAWTRLDSNGVDVGGCINTLTTHLTSPLAKGNPQHTNLVEIKRA